MPDDILVIILSHLLIKDAVIMSSISTRWRSLGCNLKQLNFDGSQKVKNITKSKLLLVEQMKYIFHVDSIIARYNHPVVQDFRIHFRLNAGFRSIIKKWLQFAADKKVEFLELDLMETCCNPNRYCFPLRLTERHLYSNSPSTSNVVELIYLRKLILKKVQVNDAILTEFVANSPHLEMISIKESQCLEYIHIDGRFPKWGTYVLVQRDLKLKHLKISQCLSVKSIDLSDFDLESFTYKGPTPPDLYLACLPQLQKLDFGPGFVGLNDDVFHKKSSWSLSLQDLSIRLYRPKCIEKLEDSLLELPNVKKLRLKIWDCKDDRLLMLASVLNSCPYLENLTVELHLSSRVRDLRKVTCVPSNPLEHLKLLKIVCYNAHISDFEIVAYIIKRAAKLKKIVVDYRWECGKVNARSVDISKREKAGRTSAKRQLISFVPDLDIELVIL